MILVLPYALPPASVAPTLVEHLEPCAPTFTAWLASAAAQVETINPSEVLCTPYQAWQLRRAGFQPPPSLPLGAGWAALRLAEHEELTPDQPIWLADFVHFDVAQQGVTLGDPGLLQLTQEEADALLDAALPDLTAAGFSARHTTALSLRVTLPEGVCPYAPTLDAAVGNEVQTWWPQDAASRPWRKALNAVQMVWHDHPVNLRRADRGLPVINGLWLCGGASRNQFIQDQPPARDEAEVELALVDSARQGDWQSWLNSLRDLEAQRFQPLARQITQGERPCVQLILTGENRLAALSLAHPRGWRRWLPQRRYDWREWWAPAEAPG